MTAYDRPIPIHKRALTAGNYKDIPIDAHDPRYAEALVDARALGIAGENYYARTDGRNMPYRAAIAGAVPELWCRQSIATMLVKVNERLAEYGAEVYLWDAYRPIACQQALWDFFWGRFRSEPPPTDDAALAERVRHYVSDPRFFDPNNPRTWPAHATGAALDLTLRDRATRELLDMGTHSTIYRRRATATILSASCIVAGLVTTMIAYATGACCIGPCKNKGSRITATSAGTSTTAIRCMP